MSSVNKAIIIGHVGKDPEVRSLPSGGSVANFSIATTEKWNDKQGKRQEQTEWHNCVAFGKLADIISQWVNKGALLYVEGRIKTEKWQDKTGADRYSTKIHADQIQMLGGRKGEASGDAEPAPKKEQKAESIDDLDSDVPF
jgi:single-strand DNA-binding protein